MNYNETLQYLYNLTKHGIKLGLKNITALLNLLGNPQSHFNSIHIAGTNGKGSTARMISALLSSAGFRTGLFTSPHLVRFTERITIDTVEITEDDVVRLTQHIRQLLKSASEINPTFFEFITALAFYYFYENSIDWAVVETGLGGRFDATNVLIPKVSVITDIGMDHKEFLGNTLKEIAFEKSGIIKEGIPLVTTMQKDEALAVLLERAKACGSQIYRLGEHFHILNHKLTAQGNSFDFKAEEPFGIFIKDIHLPLYGAHQARNAALAIETFLIALQGIKEINENLIRDCLSKIYFPGRCELKKIKDRWLLFDGAHNAEASAALEKTVYKLKEQLNLKSPVSVVGIMSDKDIEEILAPLLRFSEKVIFTKASYNRASDAETLLEVSSQILNKQGLSKMDFFKTDSVSEAIQRAFELSTPEDLVVITGSFYTVGEAMESLGYKTVLSDLREIR